MKKRPDDWSAEDLLELIEPVRSRAADILRRYEISGERAKEILSAAFLAAAMTGGTPTERRQLFIDAVEEACREGRAALGPPADHEEEPYVH